jgi:hypothetical protein
LRGVQCNANTGSFLGYPSTNFRLGIELADLALRVAARRVIRPLATLKQVFDLSELCLIPSPYDDFGVRCLKDRVNQFFQPLETRVLLEEARLSLRFFFFDVTGLCVGLNLLRYTVGQVRAPVAQRLYGAGLIQEPRGYLRQLQRGPRPERL